MPIKVGINGFGRIGRNIMRTALDDKDIQFVAVNDVTDAATLAHLLKYDSVLGNLPHKVTHTEDTISVEGKSFKVFKTKDPGEIDWPSVGADIVVESTGLFTKGADAKKHLRGSVKKVIISAPADGPTPPSSSASTTRPTIRPITTSFRTLPAPPIASLRSPKFCTKLSASTAAP